MLRSRCRCAAGNVVGCVVALVVGFVGLRESHGAQPGLPEPAVGLVIGADGEGGFTLALPGEGPFWETDRAVVNARLLELEAIEGESEEQPTVVVLWEEVGEGGALVPHRALGRARLEGEEGVDAHVFPIVGETAYTVRLRYGEFEPLGRYGSAEQEAFPDGLEAGEDCHIWIVQFWTQPLEQYRVGLREAGGVIYNFLPDHSYLVRFDDPASVEAVRGLPYVRWVGAYHPGYRVDEAVLQRLFRGEVWEAEPVRYNVMVFERGLVQKETVAEHVEEFGGSVFAVDPHGFLLCADLTPAHLASVLQLDQVLFVDLWGMPEEDMDLARQIGGAIYLESVGGFTGEGVRGELVDGDLLFTHQEFALAPPVRHGVELGSGDLAHGTSTYGIVVAKGVRPEAKGMLPGAGPVNGGAGIFATNRRYIEYGGSVSRYDHMAELVDPIGQYQAVFQSNSWSTLPRTTAYTTLSSMTDDILFTYDILVCKSQANEASQVSGQEAWAKNIVSIGGVKHRNTLTRSDDCWCPHEPCDHPEPDCPTCPACPLCPLPCPRQAPYVSGASTGPASDGRVKPDLAHFYDAIVAPGDRCCSSSDVLNDEYEFSFGGTSGATPITAGYFGLFFQMWHEGVFPGFGGDPSVFASRPHMTTAKAMLINTAYQYPFTSDLSRMRQGWGMTDLQILYGLKDNLFIVDESQVIVGPGASHSYVVFASRSPGFPLKATLVYADPRGTVPSTVHRINELSLKVTAPDGVTVYWGNSGLQGSAWSVPGGSSDKLNTVENVFIQSPVPGGQYVVTVVGTEINQDGHVETTQVDADFALVVSGVQGTAGANGGDWNGDGNVDSADVAEFLVSFAQSEADVDGDGMTSASDLFEFVEFFFGYR